MNSNREELERIGFSDGRIERVELLLSGEVIIVFKNWQERILRLRFKGVVYFKSFQFGGDDTEVQIATDTEEIREALRVIKQNGDSVEAYSNLVQITFMSDAPMMIVVFQEFENET